MTEETAVAEATEPTADKPVEQLRRVELKDGSVLMMLPMTWRMFKASAQADTEHIDRSIGELMQAIEDAVVEANFKNGRDLSRQPRSVFMDIFSGWRQAEDEVALPPANGQLSGTPS